MHKCIIAYITTLDPVQSLKFSAKKNRFSELGFSKFEFLNVLSTGFNTEDNLVDVHEVLDVVDVHEVLDVVDVHEVLDAGLPHVQPPFYNHEM